ncbi:hypothetical protein CWC12_07635 [Pseudoalteromonas ruthenica]|nr:hypothetical protein CWC12_07635 [Pseudoalteromonas ruthenica]TMP22695.1 hypothetical protein CWC06_13905 [Pseudoalteromonas ruthenica]
MKVNEKLIASSNTVYMVGKDQAPVNGLDYVHKLIVSNSNDIIFSKCWLDSKWPYNKRINEWTSKAWLRSFFANFSQA